MQKESAILYGIIEDTFRSKKIGNTIFVGLLICLYVFCILLNIYFNKKPNYRALKAYIHMFEVVTHS